MQDITTRFDAEMRAAGITQSEMGRRTGINQVTINEIARGRRRPSSERAHVLCEQIGWPIERADELFELVPRTSVRVVIVRGPEHGYER
jgi:transcriptional regulator with XRE-family HTH domain